MPMGAALSTKASDAGASRFPIFCFDFESALTFVHYSMAVRFEGGAYLPAPPCGAEVPVRLGAHASPDGLTAVGTKPCTV
jgi:hypothetical protein